MDMIFAENLTVIRQLKRSYQQNILLNPLGIMFNPNPNFRPKSVNCGYLSIKSRQSAPQPIINFVEGDGVKGRLLAGQADANGYVVQWFFIPNYSVCETLTVWLPPGNETEICYLLCNQKVNDNVVFG